MGIRSKTHAIVLAIKRSQNDLSAHQKKLYRVDDHIGIAIAGLTSDARVLRCAPALARARAQAATRAETLERASQPIHAERVPQREVALRAPDGRVAARGGGRRPPQVCTQRYGRRPFGVGLLIAGVDSTGTHIYQTDPSSNFYECKAMAIGARSQSAKTYLEKHVDAFMTGEREGRRRPRCARRAASRTRAASLDELILHGLRALRDTLPSSTELNSKNASVGVVGLDAAVGCAPPPAVAVARVALMMARDACAVEDPVGRRDGALPGHHRGGAGEEGRGGRCRAGARRDGDGDRGAAACQRRGRRPARGERRDHPVVAHLQAR